MWLSQVSRGRDDLFLFARTIAINPPDPVVPALIGTVLCWQPAENLS